MSARLGTLARRLPGHRIRRTLGAASCVTQPARFVARELRGVRSDREYRLRGSGLTAVVRHPLLDMWVLEELFRFRAYEPHPKAMRLLASAGRPLRIVDLGGHVGYFGLFVLERFPDAAVVSFEPDPDNARSLTRCIEANGRRDSWQLVEACAAVRDGTVELSSSFHLSRAGPTADELTDLQQRVGTALPFLRGTPLLRSERRRVAARDVFPFLEDADLLKIDIEGGEWELLADPRFTDLRVRALVLEYHPPYCPDPDPEGVVRRSLAAAGYEAGTSVPGDGGDLLWAWRRAASRTS